MLAQPLRPGEEMSRLGDGWIFERKLDGLRCEVVRRGPSIEMWSRNHLSFLSRFPHIAQAVLALPVPDLTLDGELVAFAGERTSFQLLQAPSGPAGPQRRTVFCAFDLLDLLGRDTTGLPWSDRSELMRQALEGASQDIILPERVTGDARALLEDACARGWEGLIAKRANSPYCSGRSSDWRKLKCTARQELVIGGWTLPAGSRTGFGALLVGHYDSSGALRYAGKVGTGFDERDLRSIRSMLESLARPTSPFADPVLLKQAHWAEPELVAEIEFSEWTRDGRLRHPSFLGLRPDKSPADVRREQYRPG